ncbi:M23 family metallopeptidase [Herbidospora mongoliensis]|uniref:M23 family metallopeptidase n=1 Tax=Herbidospora mongoliensis TaxID=688067 RepID=UPI0009FBBF2C|nr:M23 family metallopeptidase [Herbidospora mongoliensis]
MKRLSALTALAVAGASLVFAAPAQAKPGFQLPFLCGQQWRLDTWAHAPALDMVKEPNQTGTNGATLLASAAGTVKLSYRQDANGPGNVIQINHGGGWYSTYLHMATRSVSVGQTVSQGQVIGTVGATGDTSNGHPHLHFEQNYDANGNGTATWGASGTERVRPVFNGVEYGQGNGQTWRNVTSNNCGGTQPPPAPTKVNVDTFANAPGHSTPGGTRTGTLYAGTNYVYCRVRGPEVRVGSNWNTWWLKTDLDEGSPWQNQYVSAYYLSRWGNDVAKDNDGNDIRPC